MKPKILFKSCSSSHVMKKNKVQKHKLHTQGKVFKKQAKLFLERPQDSSPYTVDARMHRRKKTAIHSSSSSQMTSWVQQARSADPDEEDQDNSTESDQSDEDSRESDTSDCDFNLLLDDTDSDDPPHEEQHRPTVLLPKSFRSDRRRGSSKYGSAQGGSSNQLGIPLIPIDLYPDVEDSVSTSLSYYMYHDTGCVVVIANHPSSFVLRGEAQIFPISGSVDIFGYELSSSRPQKFVYAYSNDRLFNLPVKTTRVDTRNSNYWICVKKLLKQHLLSRHRTPKSDEAAEEFASSVLRACQPTSVIVLFKKHFLPYAVHFTYSYMPKARPNCNRGLIASNNKGFNIVASCPNAIQISTVQIATADLINYAAKLHVAEGIGEPPCILIYGERNSGKSTNLRYYINNLLSCVEQVLVLDCDPGQSEFTPPGCVSLVAVTEPLLGAPFTHLKRPLKSVFYGDIALNDFNIFFDCITEVVVYYRQIQSNSPLLINTLGWIKGLGKMCLDHIRNLLSPNIEIEIVNKAVIPPSLDAREFPKIPSNFQRDKKICLEVPHGENFRPVKNRYTRFKAHERRDLAIITYFGRLQHFDRSIMSFNHLSYKCCRFSDVVIHDVNRSYPNPKFRIHAINASIVALCHVDESQILICEDEPDEPKSVVPDANFRDCYGFGFIRGLDLEKHLIYIVTPEPFDILARTNAFVKGLISVPKDLMEKQGVYGEPIPYMRSMHPELRSIFSGNVKSNRFE